MRAITLYQPHAALVALGAKQIETRSWAVAYRGPILIHAGKRFPRAYRALCSSTHFASYVYRHDSLPRGAVVAIAELTLVEATYACYARWLARRVGTVWNWHDECEAAFGDYTYGRYAWHLRNVRALARPIPAVGHQGLWVPKPRLVAAVMRALERAS